MLRTKNLVRISKKTTACTRNFMAILRKPLGVYISPKQINFKLLGGCYDVEQKFGLHEVAGSREYIAQHHDG